MIGFALAALVLSTVASGLLHAVGGWRSYLGLLPMQMHVGAATRGRAAARRARADPPPDPVAALAAAAAPHRPRPAGRPRGGRDRRGRGGAVAGGARAGSGGRPARTRSAAGRRTRVPVTQWLFDPVPRIDPAGWRLRAAGRELDLAALAARPQRTVRAVLDCTGGWYTEQDWRGVPLAELGLPPGRSIEVVSATGYRRRFPAAEAGDAAAGHARRPAIRCRPATAARPGWSRPGGAGSGGSSG